MSECKGRITTFIIEPFIPHNEEFYLNIVSERLGCSVSFSECGGIEIEENWDKVFRNVTFFFFSVSHIMFCLLSPALITLQNHNIRMVLSFVQVKTIFVPTGACLASETSAPLVATLPLEVIDLVGYFCSLVILSWILSPQCCFIPTLFPQIALDKQLRIMSFLRYLAKTEASIKGISIIWDTHYDFKNIICPKEDPLCL